MKIPVTFFAAIKKNSLMLLTLFLTLLSFIAFFYYYANGLGLSYNDARSHLDIGRRVVESLKPGLAQIGSVWLPLPHLIMTLTIWNDWMWHSGLAGSLYSMGGYIACGVLTFLYLRQLRVGTLGQFVGGLLFATNLNLIYLQATAMTEVLLMGTMTAASYYFLRWAQKDTLLYLVYAAFWTMMATLVRYDGWFLCALLAGLSGIIAWRRHGRDSMSGIMIVFSTLAGFGIVLWFMWNVLIFRDPFYFMSGPYSARAQQKVLESEGKLPTKGDWGYSLYTYSLASLYNIGFLPIVVGILGLLVFYTDRKHSLETKLASMALWSPFIFNIISLYLGQSVIYLQNITAETWFNVRYGLLSYPLVAVAVGYLVDRARHYRPIILTSLLLFTVVTFTSHDSVVIEDGKVGSSQKNVYEVSGWLHDNVLQEKGFVLISASSHDAILFSSGLPMKRFIHEGTGKYWESAAVDPSQFARWIVMRTNDLSDNTFKIVNDSGQLYKYDKVQSFPFADIYELKDEYAATVITEPVFGKQK